MRHFPAMLCVALFGAAAALASPAPELSLRERNFLTEAALLNLTQLHAGKLAEDMAVSPRARELARTVGDAHAEAHERLRAIADDLGAPLPAEPDPATRGQIAEMQTFTGPAFDRYFLLFQEETHVRALKLFEAEAEYGRDGPLRRYAMAMLDVLNEQLRAVQDLTAAITGSTAPP